ncbi:hypothetical protein FNV43_RR04856 [Rhamnella rubrinervis]|uniref:FAF domain-containing protein n=1 Tax=Rhamnella rubrinervis TaxID=2594499 RepID=A0A8K0HMV4_9ROSA|nr:hypothetical protein FNV43_RR04856 [Rhamnella rubrinervis]
MNPWKWQHVPSSFSGGGLGLVTATGEIKRPPNVLESAAIKSSSISPPSSPSPAIKKDPGGIGFIDDMGGGIDGLMSCTESLGFESSDERRADDQIEAMPMNRRCVYEDDHEEELCLMVRPWTNKKWRKMGERREVKKFPPPLSSLNRNGQPSFFLRPVRKDGRLELTEVRIDRPEILRAYREDGRLRLHLLVSDDEPADEDCIQEEEKEGRQEKEDIEEEEDEEEVKEIIEEDRVDEWKFSVSGEGIRRCHELVNHHGGHHHHHHHSNHHHHHMPVWSQHCVITSVRQFGLSQFNLERLIIRKKKVWTTVEPLQHWTTGGVLH